MQFIANIDVDNLERAIGFYEKCFGLRVGRRFGASGVEMLGSSTPIYLLVKPPGSAPTSTQSEKRSYRRHWTPIHLDFVVDEVESAVQNAIDAGATLETPIATFKWGKLALMADPFGHGFCLLQLLGRGYDEIAE